MEGRGQRKVRSTGKKKAEGRARFRAQESGRQRAE
jgi:hypothetical protein